MVELQFRATAAAGYDQSVGLMTLRYIPPLLRAASIAPGQRVLDIATGTGNAAEAAATAIGPSGRSSRLTYLPQWWRRRKNA